MLMRLVGNLREGRWWELSRSFLEAAIRLAGFTRVELAATVDVRVRHLPDTPAPRAAFRAAGGREAATVGGVASAITG
jgi:hypothetical protein